MGNSLPATGTSECVLTLGGTEAAVIGWRKGSEGLCSSLHTALLLETVAQESQNSLFAIVTKEKEITIFSLKHLPGSKICRHTGPRCSSTEPVTCSVTRFPGKRSEAVGRH